MRNILSLIMDHNAGASEGAAAPSALFHGRMVGQQLPFY